MSSVDGPIPIAFCITELDPGGAERALVQLVTRLDRRHWAPVVYCLAGEGELVVELESRDIPVTCLGARGVGSLGVIPRLSSLLRKQRPAILQTYLYHANIVGRIAGRMARVPHIVSGIRVAEQRSRFRLWLDRKTDRWVERHVCVSEAVAKFSIERGELPSEKLVVIPNGVDAERYRDATPIDTTQFGVPAGSPIVLFVGRLDAQKGPLDLIHALRLLAAKRDDVHALFVGDGPLREEMEATILASGLQHCVHLLGRRNDVPGLMKAATCLALPSHWEGMPNVVLEAMAAGLLVIATQVEGTTELLQGGGGSGDLGLLVPVGNPASLTEGIEQILTRPDGLNTMAVKSQHYVASSLTWDSTASAYAQLYRDLLRG
ncbi:MAG: glycosyltransferase [Planctomycetaceae bacterium]|nr:glycosyltransferase [Planctomycetaceae bacterium]MBT6487160.1 glycosyltransferase [Planctomycetaceae bacterium]